MDSRAGVMNQGAQGYLGVHNVASVRYRMLWVFTVAKACYPGQVSPAFSSMHSFYILKTGVRASSQPIP